MVCAGTRNRFEDIIVQHNGAWRLSGDLAVYAPERIRQEAFGKPADIWAVAALVWEMGTKVLPYSEVVVGEMKCFD